MTLQVIGITLSVVLSAAATVTSSLVLFTLRSMSSRIDRLEKKQGTIVLRKTECQRDFVSAESWVRSETYTRQKLDTIGNSMSKMAASITIIEKLPAIAGNIAKEIVTSLRENK